MKVGRNDPCPCGSGKKYKQCCLARDEATRSGQTEWAERLLLEQSGLDSLAELDAAMRRYEMYCRNIPASSDVPTLMEFLGRPNAATESEHGLQDELRGRHFASQEELQAYVSAYHEESNNTPQERFEGMTPAEMQRLLYGSLDECHGIVSINPDLPDDVALSSDLINAIRFVLEYLQDHDVKLTQAGYFPRTMCRRYLLENDPHRQPTDTVPSERLIPVLATAHDIAIALGYADETSNRTTLTTEGVGILSRGSWAGVFRAAVSYFVDVIDWKEFLDEDVRHGHFDLIQQSAVFVLYLLRNRPRGTEGGLFERFEHAFPAFTSFARETPDANRFLRGAFRLLMVREFLVPFGFVRLHFRREEYSIKDGAHYETTELFRSALRWHR